MKEQRIHPDKTRTFTVCPRDTDGDGDCVLCEPHGGCIAYQKKQEAKRRENMQAVVLCEHLARIYHSGQTRNDKHTAYIVHPERVALALAFRGAPPRIIAAGWLHDVLEDTSATVEGLRAQGVPDEVIRILRLLNKKEVRPDEPYELYIDRIADDPDALQVKVADILDNLMDAPGKNQVAKYSTALFRLLGYRGPFAIHHPKPLPPGTRFLG